MAVAPYSCGAMRFAYCALRTPWTPRIGRDLHPTPPRVRRASTLPLPGRVKKLHRHLAVPHRCARGEALRGVDDGIGVDVVVAVEVVDAAGLAEMLDAER